MREHFGLREAFNGYLLVEVLIITRGYMFSMVPLVLATVFHWGVCIVGTLS